MDTSPHPAAFAPGEKDVDAINRRAWSHRATVREYERLQGWTDPGERTAIEFVADEARGQPILDMGAGAGRTTQFLVPISGDYAAIDYTQEMVTAFRKLHPGLRIEQMDARDLSAFPDGQFALVVFSYNGIDAVDYDGRMKVLREVHRVLRPGGRFLFSAHNLEGPGHDERPKLYIPFTWNPVKLGWRSVKAIRALPRSWSNYRKYHKLGEHHDGWALWNAGAHEFSILIMYTSLAEQKRQLRDAGFDCEAVFDSARGRPVPEGADTHDIFWFHFVARKAA